MKLKESMIGSKNLSHSHKHVHVCQAKDELEVATNWERAITTIYREIKWINAYAALNEVAAMHLLKDFMRSHFLFDDNVLDKSVIAILKEHEFVKKKNIQGVKRDIVEITAEYFTHENKKKAI